MVKRKEQREFIMKDIRNGKIRESLRNVVEAFKERCFG